MDIEENQLDEQTARIFGLCCDKVLKFTKIILPETKYSKENLMLNTLSNCLMKCIYEMVPDENKEFRNIILKHCVKQIELSFELNDRMRNEMDQAS